MPEDTLAETHKHVAAALRDIEDALTFTVLLPAHRSYLESAQARLLLAMDAGLESVR